MTEITHALAFQEHHFWSPVLGVSAVRLSMVDEHNGEFFMIIPDPADRSYRAARDRALSLIVDAIQAGYEPGEVRLQ